MCENKIHTKCIQQRKQGCDWELAAFFEEYSSKRSCRYPAAFAYLCAVHSFQELYTVCSVGSFSSKTSTGQTTCTKCPDGYTSNPGASSALDCYITGFGRRSTGTENETGTQPEGCPGGEAVSVRTGVCVYCAAGKYSPDGAPDCVTCPSGKFSATKAAQCTDCVVGTSLAGSSTCNVSIS